MSCIKRVLVPVGGVTPRNQSNRPAYIGTVAYRVTSTLLLLYIQVDGFADHTAFVCACGVHRSCIRISSHRHLSHIV